MPGADDFRIPSLDLPQSVYVSAEAHKAFQPRRGLEPRMRYSKETIGEVRHALNQGAQQALDRAHALFQVDVENTEIGQVPVGVVRPQGGVSDAHNDHILIELHPGAFIMGYDYGLVESIAMAALGRIQVVTVNYRLAPENRFPAATEDVAAVYQGLLRKYAAPNIGILGSSAGGLLAAQAMAWFQQRGLPTPGAIAIMGSSADARFDGDSRYLMPASGYQPPPGSDIVEFMLATYYANADLKNPLISPAWSFDVLATFPPTLLATSTRAHDLSSAVFTHRQLIKAGVTADLQLWEGLPHCFYFNLELPESREFYGVAAKFFAKHLGSR